MRLKLHRSIKPLNTHVNKFNKFYGKKGKQIKTLIMFLTKLI